MGLAEPMPVTQQADLIRILLVRILLHEREPMGHRFAMLLFDEREERTAIGRL
jgi:hypothetical protein